MQTHDTRPVGFQPTASAPKAKPLIPPSFEVVEPGRGSVNPFPPRPHEVWTAEPPSALPVTVSPEVQAQVEPQNQNIDLFWTEFRMNAPETPPAPLPKIGNGGGFPAVQREPVTPEPYWYKGHSAQSATAAPPEDAQRAEPATQAMTQVQRRTTGETETAQEPRGDNYNWIESHFRMNAPDTPSPPPPVRTARVAAVQRAPVTPEPYWYQGPPMQAKLTVGAPNDVYEQEADRVAAQVLSMPDSATQQPIQRERVPGEETVQTKPLAATITPLVQRDAMPEAEDKKEEDGNIAQAKLIQRDAMSEEELQRKPSLQRAADGSLQTGNNLESQLNSSQGGGAPLPEAVRSFMEPRFGADFTGVRVHTGSESVQMNRELNAQAFTHKQDVYFGAGKAPGNDALTAHELTQILHLSR